MRGRGRRTDEVSSLRSFFFFPSVRDRDIYICMCFACSVGVDTKFWFLQAGW